MVEEKKIQLIDGIVLNVMNDYIGKQIENKRNYYEYEILTYFLDYLPTNGVIYDIGANIGNHTVFFKKYLKPKKVISFEPSRELFELLNENVKNNYLDEIETYNIAVGDRNSFGKIIENEDNMGASKVIESEKGNIEIKTLDSMGKDIPNFVKIDVEGFELKVLHGMKNIIQIHKPVVWIEIFEENFEEVDEFFKENNYVIIDRWLDNYVYMTVDEQNYRNLFDIIKRKAFRRYNSEINRLTLLIREKNSVIKKLDEKLKDAIDHTASTEYGKILEILAKLEQQFNVNELDEKEKILNNINFISREEELIKKIEQQVLEIQRIEMENSLLKSELQNSNREKELLMRKYNSLKNSKLGKLTLKYWAFRNQIKK